MNVNDNINMEYEARVMITQNQYSLIKKSYLESGVSHRHFININHYFDDVNLSLTNKGIVLRLRSIDEKKFELTLKIKGKNGDIEINNPLTSNQAKEIMNNQRIKNSEMSEMLSKNNIDVSTVKLICSLKTDRIEIQEDDYLLVIDKNNYRGKEDYNLEVESSTKPLAIAKIKEICAKFGVEYKKDYISKSRRAIYNL